MKHCLLLLLISIFKLNAESGLVVKVGPEFEFKSINEAVENAPMGSTIIVSEGRYAEKTIIITKPLKLIGDNHPTLDGNGSNEIMVIASPDVQVSGFRFINTGHSSMEDRSAIKCLDAHQVVISENVFENTFFAIHLSNTNNAVIDCNTLKSKAEFEFQYGNGIHLWKCYNAWITGNSIIGHRDGIYLEFATSSHIQDNVSHGNIRYGLHFMFSHRNSYRFNKFSNNGAGVAVMYTTDVIMEYNEFSDNWGPSSYGMLLKDIRDSSVKFNKFLNNTSGIYMEGTSRTIFEENLFRNNGYGVKLLASCDDNDFRYNNFQLNTIDMSTNGMTVLNRLNQNYWDKYTGYDLDKDGIGDVVYRPVSIFSMIVEQIPPAVILWRSLLVQLLDKAEKTLPVVTPENLKDTQPLMKAYDIN